MIIAVIKAIFFDIDGTLLPMDTHEVPQSAGEALRRMHQKGIRLFIATGRPPIQLQLMPVSLLSLPFDGFVFLNGQYCMKSDGTVVRQKCIDQKTLHQLIPWLKEQSFPCSVFELNHSYDLRFNEQNYHYLESIGRLDQMPPIEDALRAYDHDTYQICPYIEEKQDEEFLKHAPGMESARWTPAFADMIPKGGGKPKGMEAMCREYHMNMCETMAFGDAGNDVGMLKAAEIGVAMGNGTKQAKAAADYVTDDILKDGIWKACRHFGLLENGDLTIRKSSEN